MIIKNKIQIFSAGGLTGGKLRIFACLRKFVTTHFLINQTTYRRTSYAFIHMITDSMCLLMKDKQKANCLYSIIFNICIYIYYIYIYKYIYIYIYAYIYTYIYIHKHIYTHTNIYTQTLPLSRALLYVFLYKNG